MKKIYLLLTALFVVLLAGCASHKISDYTAEKPKFDMKQYFNGRIIAHGIVTDRSGKVTRRMVVDMKCTWNGDVGTLDEDFTYADGKKEKRVWTIRKQGDRYIGTAADVIGEAVGEAAGNTCSRWMSMEKIIKSISTTGCGRSMTKS
jgi:Protein of unknown function (DUF3833)